jgi:hypothetical protein
LSAFNLSLLNCSSISSSSDVVLFILSRPNLLNNHF